jgi:hypothetical protein
MQIPCSSFVTQMLQTYIYTQIVFFFLTNQTKCMIWCTHTLTNITCLLELQVAHTG